VTGKFTIDGPDRVALDGYGAGMKGEKSKVKEKKKMLMEEKG